MGHANGVISVLSERISIDNPFFAIKAHEAPVSFIKVICDENDIVTGSQDKSLKFWRSPIAWLEMAQGAKDKRNKKVE